MEALGLSRPRACIDALRRLADVEVAVGRAVREQHGTDVSFLPGAAPDAVAFPESVSAVAAIARTCHAHGVAMIPFGAGTSTEAQIAAPHGGVSIDLGRMNRILEVDAPNFCVRVEPGVTRKQLNRALRDTGLFFPIDPGADATLGGMAATRASGTNAVRYGTMRDAVLSALVVLADGRVIRTGTRAPKSAAGLDLTALFVGSGGILGTIAELTVRLHPIPEAIRAASASFPTGQAAVDVVLSAKAHGIAMARIEYLDARAMEVINRQGAGSFACRPTLFLEFHGSPAGVAEQVALVEGLARDAGGSDFAWAETQEARAALWQARHDVFWAGLSANPGRKGWPTDVCVPVAALPACLDLAEARLAEAGLPYIVVGHVGDGNFHVVFFLDPDDPAELAAARAVDEAMVTDALARGGTCTGEHGIGVGKIAQLVSELGPDAVAAMRAIKQALDPRGLMNPGKMMVDGDAASRASSGA